MHARAEIGERAVRNRDAFSDAGRLQRFALEQDALDLGLGNPRALAEHLRELMDGSGFVERAAAHDSDAIGTQKIHQMHEGARSLAGPFLEGTNVGESGEDVISPRRGAGAASATRALHLFA